MPEVAAWAAAAVVGGLELTGAAAAIVAAAVKAGVYMAASAGLDAIGSALSPEVASSSGRPTEWNADPDAPIPFVMGLRGTAGQIVHRDTYGPDNRYQGIVTVYSGGGPVNSMGGSFYVDSVAKTFTGELMDGTPTNRLWRQTKTGAQPDTALTSPTVTGSYTLTNWTSAHKLSGFASSMITLRQDGDFKFWPTGEPRTYQEIQGILAWDPRLDSTWPGGAGACRLATPSTWVYSTNPIIHALKWALGIKHNSIMVGGIGASVGAIDVTAFIDAANVADTNSWTVSAVAYSLDDKFQVFQALLQAGGALPSRRAGQISCISRAAAPSSIVTISSNDTAGPWEFQAGAPREGRINTIIPRCVGSATYDWDMIDLAPVTSATYVTEDGGATRSRGVDYPYVSSVNQAAQLARYDIADSREGITGTIPLKPYLRDLDPGDAFTITDDGFAMSGQKCLVLSRSYDPKTDVVTVTFRSETSAKHAWALAGTGTAPSSPSLGFTDPITVPTPSGSDWTFAAGTGGVPSFTITGAVPTSVNAGKIVVEHKSNAAGTWLPIGEFSPDTTKIEELGITANTAWVARMAYRNPQGALGDWLTFSTATSGYVAGGGIGLATVDTEQLVDEAATVQDVQIQTTGWGAAGPITIAYSVTAGTGAYTQVDEYTFTYDGEGTITIIWIGLIQWEANAARQANMLMSLNSQAPTYLGSPTFDDSQYQVRGLYYGNQNNLTATAVLGMTFVSGDLTVGSNTIKIWGRGNLSGANQPVLDVNAITQLLVSKK